MASEKEALSTVTANVDDRAMLTKADELVRLFQDAIKLGYSITFTPEQLQALVTICENGYLVKQEKEKRDEDVEGS